MFTFIPNQAQHCKSFLPRLTTLLAYTSMGCLQLNIPILLERGPHGVRRQAGHHDRH